MKRCHFIGIDEHCQFCEIAVVNAAAEVVQSDATRKKAEHPGHSRANPGNSRQTPVN
jgi:hypothetical protein